MAEMTTVKSAPKRRRILDPSAIVPVPIYSNQVNKCLLLKTGETEDERFWSKFSSDLKKRSAVVVSDSDDDEGDLTRQEPLSNNNNIEDVLRSPSPPPPESLVQRPSRKAKLKLNEIERQLHAVNSLMSPVNDSRRGRQGRRRSKRLLQSQKNDDNVISLSPAEEDDDVIITSLDLSPLGSPFRAEREIPLKVRCRTDLHKIPVLPSTALSFVVETLSVILEVPPPRLLLLREEAELSPDATVQELGLGIADIIECVVMADEVKNDAPAAADSDDIIKVRLQGKDRGSAQEFSVHRDAPLGLIFSMYLSALTKNTQKKHQFHFDGLKLSPDQTPAQLEMEDGDIIEVWA